MNPSPKSVDVSLSQGVTIEWGDAHRSQYAVKYLREKCPCATCTNKHGEPVAPKPPNPLPLYQPAVALTAVEPAGRYALQFYFSDNHSYGLYTWEYLREICPCAQCHPH